MVTNSYGISLRSEMMLRSLLLLLLPAALQAQARSSCTDPLADARWRSTPLVTMISSPTPGERDVERYVTGMLPLLAQSFRDPAAGSMPATAMDEDRLACLAAGMHDHVAKPIDLPPLVAAIGRACEQPLADVASQVR